MAVNTLRSLASAHSNGRPLAPRFFNHLPSPSQTPDLLELQLSSYQWFLEELVKQLFEELSPIKDLTGNKVELEFVGYEFREPRNSEQECLRRDLTYAAPLYVRTRLRIKSTGEVKEPFEVFFGDLPLMTDRATFIISGTERVVISQLIRSPGAYFVLQEDPASGRSLCLANLIPSHGVWLEFETSSRDVISVKVDGRRKLPVTTLLRAIGFSSDDELLGLFSDVDTDPSHHYINATIEREPMVRDSTAALLDIYRSLRPGDPPNADNARRLLTEMFFSVQHYDLGIVGRYKLNHRLGLSVDRDERALTREDVVAIVRHIIMVNNGADVPDDIDHLGNRRIRTVGELVQNQLRIGLMRLERVARERMSVLPVDALTPAAVINIRPVVATVREFFGGSQLAQFMDQTNPLAELTHKRRLSAMGPGGLSRERAGFEVRDVHYSHYGRICPIETPEGPNIGLIGSLAVFGRVNRYGFIETPYRKVLREVSSDSPDLVGRTLGDEVLDKNGTVIAGAGEVVTDFLAKRIASEAPQMVKVIPFVSTEVVYLTADVEDRYIIAQANALLDNRGQFLESKVGARLRDDYIMASVMEVELIDISPNQIFSVSASLIPFLEHDDANRALMGANMQRQAVPLLCPEAPVVATGMEVDVARYSGQLCLAKRPGIVKHVSSSIVEVQEESGELDRYVLQKFVRTNQGTCVNQRALVSVGQRVSAGEVLADGSATQGGELALGQNVVCAFMSWEGYNYEDAVVVSSRLVEEDKFTSIHVFRYEIESRVTKLGNEEITRDIPNVSEESLRNLDEDGIIRIGVEVGADDILVGKITPKGETELSAEEKLLRAIFGEKARDVKDTSLRMPHGEWGKVINVRVFSRDDGDELPARVIKRVQVWVAQKRKLSVGDKLAGRHGNKGVISVIVPVEDMPILPDGTPVDIVLNPIGVPSRMNLGQIMETHLGWVAQVLGFQAVTPVFDGASDSDIEDNLALVWLMRRAVGSSEFWGPHAVQAVSRLLEEEGYSEDILERVVPGKLTEVCLRLWLKEKGVEGIDGLTLEGLRIAARDVSRDTGEPVPISGKVILRDGRTGEPFDQPVTAGCIYMMKLIHLVEDKVHARSTGPYSLISQQPLGGKAQFGGQRFGEMEVWALEAYGAAFNLQEMLTVKSDDISGRSKTYEAIVKGEDILTPGIPESFKVLVKELQSLGLAVEVLNEREEGEVMIEDGAVGGGGSDALILPEPQEETEGA